MMVHTVLVKKTRTFIENKILKYLKKMTCDRKKRGKLYPQPTGKEETGISTDKILFPIISPARQIFH